MTIVAKGLLDANGPGLAGAADRSDAHTRAMALGEGDILGGYRIVRLIGRGGMGSVYLADDVRLGRKVALKVLTAEAADQPSVRDRFLRESQMAASLDHPNILPIYEAGEVGGQPFIAMRYVPVLDLDGLIRRDGPLGLERTTALIDQVATALDAAHAAGLIHRDVKPGNILVATGSQLGTDHAYLTDFGLGKHADYSTQLTRSGQLMGSVGYVAPEQIENRPIDARVDVYSLGCVLFECLAGAQPYPRESEMATLYAHVQAPPPSLAEARPELPPTIDAVIASALAKVPDERYATAGELARALAAAGAPDAAERHLTRGFLFADLRGYTAFVEAHGDAAAAGLLEVYRRLVRDVVRRFGGAEIKTEGDSFYVVFPSASDAVRCGLAITGAAGTASVDHPERPIHVGVGVHAGESTETAEGYVGSAVNIAARVCAQAAAGEVLVTDTVRGLTRTSGDVAFRARGRKHLKGIAEPVALYAADAAASAAIAAVADGGRGTGRMTRLLARRQMPGRGRVIVAGTVIAIAGALAVIALALGGRNLTSSPRPSLGALVGGTSIQPSASRPSNAAAPSPTSTVALNGREEQLLTHVPGQFRTGCAPAPGLAGRAQIVCPAPGIGSITYTAYDNVAAMRADYDRTYGSGALQDAHDVGRIRDCPEGPYQRSYYQAAGTQSGRVSCLVEGNIPNVAWTDERLAIITLATTQDLQGPGVTLEALHRWWQRREAGPIP
jgi:serine/threonine-protein kinase